MALLTTGPVNKNFSEGNLTNWHLEILNRSTHKDTIAFTVYTVFGAYPKFLQLETKSAILFPGDYTFLTILIPSRYEHTMAVIEVPDMETLVTLYGRSSDYRQLSGAVYRMNDLINITKS